MAAAEGTEDGDTETKQTKPPQKHLTLGAFGTRGGRTGCGTGGLGVRSGGCCVADTSGFLSNIYFSPSPLRVTLLLPGRTLARSLSHPWPCDSEEDLGIDSVKVGLTREKQAYRAEQLAQTGAEGQGTLLLTVL